MPSGDIPSITQYNGPQPYWTLLPSEDLRSPIETIKSLGIGSGYGPDFKYDNYNPQSTVQFKGRYMDDTLIGTFRTYVSRQMDENNLSTTTTEIETINGQVYTGKITALKIDGTDGLFRFQCTITMERIDI